MVGENFRQLKVENGELKEELEKIRRLYEGKVQQEKKEDYSKRVSL